MTRLWLEAFLLSVLLNDIPNCRAGSAGAEVVSAVKEEDAVLLCLNSNVTDPKSSYRIRFVRSATGTSPEKLIFQRPKKSQEAHRVSLEDNGKGRFCLLLKSLQKTDEGLYRCEIWEGWDIIQVQNISLKVKDCRTLESEKATLGLPFKLKCKLNATTAPLNISWVKLKGAQHASVNYTRVQTDGLFLTIRSMADSDQGWYRCNYIVGQSQRCSKINLRVEEGVFVVTTVPVPTSQTALTTWKVVQITRETKVSETLVPVVASVVSGLFILAVLTVLIFYKRNAQRCGGQLPVSAAGSTEFYENVTLPRLFDTTNRINSLYSFQDENTCSE